MAGGDGTGPGRNGAVGLSLEGPLASEHRTARRPLPAPRVRVDAGKTIRRATAYVCGLGFFDLHVNGQLIGDQLMNPALTGYDQRALYVTFDVTDAVHVRAPMRSVSVLSNGRFFAPRSQNPDADAQLWPPPNDRSIASRVRRRLGADGRQRTNLEADDQRSVAREQRIRRRRIRRARWKCLAGDAPASTIHHGSPRSSWIRPADNSKPR